MFRESNTKQIGFPAQEKAEFDLTGFAEPVSYWWPGYFWIWNGPLEPDVLVAQLRDMCAHDARSVCALPEPHAFEPNNHSSQMDVEYLSPAFFDRVRVAVEEASRLGMNYWLYDEGGWPSGNACGLVLAARPELAARVMRADSSGTWREATVPPFISLEDAGTSMRYPDTDQLNAESTRVFLDLTHEAYARTVGTHFGSAIRFAFTDEPAFRRALPGKEIPWTEDLPASFAERFGYDIEENLDAFLGLPGRDELTEEAKRVRADFFDWCAGRLTAAYVEPLRTWCRAHGLLSAGHLAGDDESRGAVKYGFGQILRVLRGMDVPGIDVIGRQIFPGQVNSNFPKFAATAARQQGSPFVLSESFALYGNGLTLEQAKWVLDYQFVRGITLVVFAAYPLSTRDHSMAGLRPHFGPANPLWDYMPALHGYTARLSYALSRGKPEVKTAVYYPARDIWAEGTPCAAVEVFEAILQALLERQCEFDLIDDDMLTGPEAQRGEGRCHAGGMCYEQIILGPCEWMPESSIRSLNEFMVRGGELIRVAGPKPVKGGRGNRSSGVSRCNTPSRSINQAIQAVHSLVSLAPPCMGIRVTKRCIHDGAIYFAFNEGCEPYDGVLAVAEELPAKVLDAATGTLSGLPALEGSAGYGQVPLSLAPGESVLLLFDPTEVPPRTPWTPVHGVPPIRVNSWEAGVVRQYEIGVRDFEVRTHDNIDYIPVSLGGWSQWLGADFSGEVSYRASLEVPADWRGYSICLDLGSVEYAAHVWLNGYEVSRMAWRPFRIYLPCSELATSLDLEIRVTNTLANALASDRVDEWPSRWRNSDGSGWPGQFHDECCRNERDSRGGGLLGPVRVFAVTCPGD